MKTKHNTVSQIRAELQEVQKELEEQRKAIKAFPNDSRLTTYWYKLVHRINELEKELKQSIDQLPQRQEPISFEL